MTAKKPGKLDIGARMAALSQTASEAAADRVEPNAKWAAGRQITEHQPSAVAPANVQWENAAVSAGEATAQTSTPMSERSPAPGAMRIGQVYDVPIHLIDPNPLGARYFYRVENIEQVGKTMKEDGQDVPANGYVEGGRVVLYDGGTRLRSATQYGINTLQLKIESPPADRKDLYKRSARLNDQRSDHTALDVAVSMAKLLKEGIYASQDEIAGDITDRKGNALSKQQVSMYLRIARIPDAFLAKMSYHDQTSTFTIAYEISALFSMPDYEDKADQYNQVASEVIDEIQKRQLSKAQAQTLIRSKLDGKQTRMRADVSTVKVGNAKGTIKVFPGRGQLEFSVTGLDEQMLEQLRDSIERACSGQFTLAP